MKANIPKGMGGGSGMPPGNMQAEYSATAGGGAVSATVNGKHDLVALTISPDVVDPDDAEMLADLVMAAINEANRAAAKDAEAKMGSVTGGMNIPGLF